MNECSEVRTCVPSWVSPSGRYQIQCNWRDKEHCVTEISLVGPNQSAGSTLYALIVTNHKCCDPLSVVHYSSSEVQFAAVYCCNFFPLKSCNFRVTKQLHCILRVIQKIIGCCTIYWNFVWEPCLHTRKLGWEVLGTKEIKWSIQNYFFQQMYSTFVGKNSFVLIKMHGKTI